MQVFVIAYVLRLKYSIFRTHYYLIDELYSYIVCLPRYMYELMGNTNMKSLSYVWEIFILSQ